MQIVCPRCGKVAAGNDIDLGQRLAVCRPCSEVFPLPAALSPFTPGPSEWEERKLYRPVDLRWTERRDARGCEVVIRPRRAAAIAPAIFATFWNAIMLAVVVGIIVSGNFVVLPFLSLHIGAGLLVAYIAACGLFNRTHARIDRSAFTFARRPIPQRGKVDEPMPAIERFDIAPPAPAKRGSMAHDLMLLTRDGRAVRVHFGFDDPAAATYAAGRLNQLLEQARKLDLDPYRGVRVAADDASEEEDELPPQAAARGR
jgi:hypothetical protein